MTALDLLTIAQSAIAYAQAVVDTRHFRDVLKGGYHAWRTETENFESIKRGSVEWDAMLAATAGEYRLLQNAKDRERRSKNKLLALVSGEVQRHD